MSVTTSRAGVGLAGGRTERKQGSPVDAHARHRRDQTVLVVVALILAMIALAWFWLTLQASSASFSDQEMSVDNRLGTGTLDITASDETVRFTATNMAAGDSAFGQIVLENDGTLPLTYDIVSFATDSPLRDELSIVGWRSTTPCAANAPASAPVWRPLDDDPEADAVSGALATGATARICLRADLPIDAPQSVQGERVDLLVAANASHDVEAMSGAEQ